MKEGKLSFFYNFSIHEYISKLSEQRWLKQQRLMRRCR